MKKQLFEIIWHELFIKSWWVWVCCIISFGLYEQGSYRISKEITVLQNEKSLIINKTLLAKAKKETLGLQLDSLSDPAWIELELIQNLGLVPEGYTKISLKDDSK